VLTKLRSTANKLRRELEVYRLVLKDKRTPLFAKITLGLAIGYLLLPFDVIPDWIPFLGQIDDVVVVPLLVFVALKFIPPYVIEECRQAILKQT
jgi:uncharacterized membrane protein YkvA (DUF1232 family)